MKKICIFIIIILCFGCNSGSSRDSDNGDNNDNNSDNNSDHFECVIYEEVQDVDDFDLVNPPDDMIVFVVIGQSNAYGSAIITIEDMEIFQDVYLMIDDSNNWIKARNAFNKFSNLIYGPERINFAYTFAKELIREYPDKSFGIVSNARGSTNINQWNKGGSCYECTMDRLAVVPYEIKAILVHQGEADKDNPNWLYFAQEMIEDMRYELGNIPFMFGELASWNPEYERFNTNLWQLPEMVDDVGIVSSEGLTGHDIAHFDREGQFQLGIRYFEVVHQFIDPL